jgi:hypothetical protein
LHSHSPNPLTRLAELTFKALDNASLTRQIRDLVDPAATIRLSGRESDVDGYIRHVVELRSAMSHGVITVVEEIQEDRKASGGLAIRVIVHMNMKDGAVVLGESHLVGRLGDGGRITRMVEIGRVIADGDDQAESSI